MKKFISSLMVICMCLTSTYVPSLAIGVDNDYRVLPNGLIEDSTLDKQSDDDDVVEVPSWNLRRGILVLNDSKLGDKIKVSSAEEAQKIIENTPITKRMIRKVAHLSPEQCGVHDYTEDMKKVNNIKGLEEAENLEKLSLVYQLFNDITPIKNLTKLKELDLRDCSNKDGVYIKDISPLTNLTKLEILNIKGSNPTDLKPLEGLVKLKKLDMQSTKITNIDFTKNMIDLTYLNTQFSPVKSLEPLRNHNKLDTLLASGPKPDYINPKNYELIKDLSPISELTSIKELDLNNHQVKDLSPLKKFVNLKNLSIQNNKIEDLEILLTLPKLDRVWVQENPAFPSYATSENAYREAKVIYKTLNKNTLTKADISNIEKLENSSKEVKYFYKKSTLDTLSNYKKELETKDSVENKAFNYDSLALPENPEEESGENNSQEKDKFKKIVKVLDELNFSAKKGEDISKILPKKVRVGLKDAGEITKDDREKIGTFRRNFDDGVEFGPTSIAYKLVDEKGNIIKESDLNGALVGVSEKDGAEITFSGKGQYFEYLTQGSAYYFKLALKSDKYEIIGDYGFEQELCPVYKAGTVRDVIANENKVNRHEANKEVEKYYVIKVKEKIKSIENPKLGIGMKKINDNKSTQTITYKVVDSKNNLISARNNPELIYAFNSGNSQYNVSPLANGDYFTFEVNDATLDQKICLKSDEYELIGYYEYGTDYDVDTMGGKVTKVLNGSLEKKYYNLSEGMPGEEVFVIKVKKKGEVLPPSDSKPNPETVPQPNPNTHTTDNLKIGFIKEEAAIKFKVVDEKGDLLKASEISKDLEINLDEFKKLEVDGDLFKHSITEANGATYNPIKITSEKYDLLSNIGFKCSNAFWSSPTLNKVFINGNEEVVTDASKVDSKYFTLVVKEKSAPINLSLSEAEITKDSKTSNSELFKTHTDSSTIDTRQKSKLKSGDEVAEVEVEWDLSTIKNQAGRYEIVGKFTLKNEAGITNPNKIVAKAIVNIGSDSVKPVNNKKILELNGKDRYETATQISKNNFKNIKDGQNIEIILASGELFADALAASSLCEVENKSLLLTGPDGLDKATKDEIIRLKAKKVTIVGGKNTIDDKVVKELDTMGIKVERIAGTTRYNTSEKISRMIMKKNPSVKSIILVDGRNYPDALAMSSVSAEKHMGILLTDGKNLSAEAKDIIKEMSNVIIVGGTNSVPKSIENDVKGMGKSVERISGYTRFDTAIAIANKFYPNAKKVVISNGYKYQDALSGAYIGAMEKAPTILVSKDSVPTNVSNTLRKYSLEQLIVLGGENSISNDLKNNLSNFIK